jgi:glycosyltransferase involved in cell wall biosynthesis
MKLKILVVMPTLERGGAEIVGRNWASGLANLGHDMTIFLTHEENNIKTYLGSRVIKPKKPGILSSAILLKQVLKQGDFDVALSLMPVSNLLLILCAGITKSKTRVVISEHAIIGGSLGAGWRQKVIYSACFLVYKQADAAIAVSHAVATNLIFLMRLPRQSIFVLPNALLGSLEPPDYSQLPNQGTTLLNLLVVGRNSSEKRLDYVPQILEHIQASDPSLEVVLHVFGGNSDMLSNTNVGKSQIQLISHGWVANWWEAAPAESVVLVTSEFEGFGNILVEAAYAGIPTVAPSRALGVADSCIPGVTGILVMDDLPESFAKGIYEARGLRHLVPPTWLQRFLVSEVSLELENILIGVIKD